MPGNKAQYDAEYFEKHGSFSAIYMKTHLFQENDPGPIRPWSSQSKVISRIR